MRAWIPSSSGGVWRSIREKAGCGWSAGVASAGTFRRSRNAGKLSSRPSDSTAARKQRVSTENIGLARLRDGTELVRIGEPLRPEFAACRYGDQFGRRRRRQLLLAGGGVGVVGAALAAGAAAGVTLAIFGGLVGNALKSAVHGSPEKVMAKVRTDSVGTVAVRRRHLAETMLIPGVDAPLAIDLRFKGGSARLEGREALRVAATMIPHVNRFGGTAETIRSAVSSLDQSGGVEGYLERMRKSAAKATAVAFKPHSQQRKPRQSWSGAYGSGLFGLSAPERLALEMALHEESELRALRGKLAELERAWRDAEEIAAIADDMLTPPAIESSLEKMRRDTR